MPWHTQLSQALSTVSDLVEAGIVDRKEAAALERVEEEYPLRLTPHLASQLKSADSQGLRAQFVPDPQELDQDEGWPDAFFRDEVHPTPMIAQKYPNRVILYLTHLCAAYCRHCNRKSLWKSKPGFSRSLFDQAVAWLRNNTGIEEVILTGGDPLTLVDATIEEILHEIRSIPHIGMIRVATRMFTSAPTRLTDSLCDLLRGARPLVITTQFNHPDEFTQETMTALGRVKDRGITILNQITLLRGVNDNYSVMRELLKCCVESGVQPYYLFHCFRVRGALHFRTPVETGTELIQGLTGRVGGWWIPRYCLIPSQTGVKIPLSPNPVIENQSGRLILRDFLGREVPYD